MWNLRNKKRPFGYYNQKSLYQLINIEEVFLSVFTWIQPAA